MFLPFDPLIRFRFFGIPLATRASFPILIMVIFGGVLSRLDNSVTPSFNQPGLAIAAIGCAFVAVMVLAVHGATPQIIIQRAGGHIQRTHLYFFGSTPEAISDTLRPKADLFAAGIGFVTLVIIAGFFGVLTYFTNDMSAYVHLPTKTLAIGVGAMALLQISPALPFNGGQFFRVFLAYLTDNDTTGIKGAALYAQLQSAALIAVGIVLLGADAALPFWGASLLIAGLQLGTVARAIVHQSIWQQLGRSIVLHEAVGRISFSISVDASIDTAADQLLLQHGLKPILIIDSNRNPQGIVETFNLRRVPQLEWETRSVTDIMTPLDDLLRIPNTLTIFDAVNRMDETKTTIALVEFGQNVVPVSRDQLVYLLAQRASAKR